LSQTLNQRVHRTVSRRINTVAPGHLKSTDVQGAAAGRPHR
jgi:hypothetical protein